MSPSEAINRLQEQVLSKHRCPACGAHGLRPDWWDHDDMAPTYYYCPSCGWNEMLERIYDGASQDEDDEAPEPAAGEWEDPPF